MFSVKENMLHVPPIPLSSPLLLLMLGSRAPVPRPRQFGKRQRAVLSFLKGTYRRMAVEKDVRSSSKYFRSLQLRQ